jgi:NADH:ubiquinone oxidoreductase subunit 6 (subunit J)
MKVGSSYFGAVVIAEILYVAQALLGSFLFLSGTGDLERPSVHILYGAVVLLTLPGVYIYTRGDESRRTILLYSLAFIFLVGIIFRSMTTGG